MVIRNVFVGQNPLYHHSLIPEPTIAPCRCQGKAMRAWPRAAGREQQMPVWLGLKVNQAGKLMFVDLIFNNIQQHTTTSNNQASGYSVVSMGFSICLP